MAWTKRNLYTSTQNLTNMALNIDDNRIGTQQLLIEVDFLTSPATVTIIQGSAIEINGNLYVLNTSDHVFQLTSTTDRFITLSDENFDTLGNLTIGSTNTKGIFDFAKQGYYHTDNYTKTLNWGIDQTFEVSTPVNLRNPLMNLYFDSSGGFNITSTPLILNFGFTTVTTFCKYFDFSEHFNTSDAPFVAEFTGIYHICFGIACGSSTAVNATITVSAVSGGQYLSFEKDFSSTINATFLGSGLLYVEAGDSIQMSIVANSGSGYVSTTPYDSYFAISGVE